MTPNERESMLKYVQMYKFAMHDASLFLDSHPDNREALNYFNMYKSRYNQAKKEYSDKYGPLTMDDVSEVTGWTWVKGPWPWEREDN